MSLAIVVVGLGLMLVLPSIARGIFDRPPPRGMPQAAIRLLYHNPRSPQAGAARNAAPASPSEERPRVSIDITWLDAAYLAAMVSGIVAKEVWDHLNKPGSHGVDPSRIAGAFIVSPIVYASVQAQFVRRNLTLPGLALAFQNGFFWQAV